MLHPKNEGMKGTHEPTDDHAARADPAGGLCVHADQVRQEGARYVFQLNQPPEHAAVCMIRNLHDRPGFNSTALPLKGGQEIIVRISGTGLFAIIADVIPKGTGSEATIWTTPNPMVGKDELPSRMTKGC